MANKATHVKATSKPQRGGSRRKTSTRLIDAALRQSEALRLRLEGRKFQEIADELGYANKATAYNTVMTALSEVTTEKSAELRNLELLRLDAMHQALWEKALGGDLPAVDRILKLMERRSKLLGLDAPAAKPTDGDLDEQIQREFDRIKGLEEPADFGEAETARAAAGRAETIH